MRALVVGLVAAAAAFAAVALATSGGDDEERRATTRSGATLFASMGCGSCHRLAAAGASGDVGPSLDERLPGHSRATLRAAILNPPPSSGMPADFASRMQPDEVDALVSFLLAGRSP